LTNLFSPTLDSPREVPDDESREKATLLFYKALWDTQSRRLRVVLLGSSSLQIMP